MTPTTTTHNSDIATLLAPLRNDHPNLVILTSDPSYKSLTIPVNLYHQALVQPPAIIRPASTTELQTAITFLSTLNDGKGAQYTVRSGGHDMHSRYASPSLPLIDLSLLNSMTISPDRATATVEPGVTSLHLLEVLDGAGLTAPVGTCGAVSVTGWAAGGGYGVGNGIWGMGCDGIVAGSVITPSGRVVSTNDNAADEVDAKELLYCLRGAGLGNFGVISSLTIKVYPRPRQLAGLLAFPLAEAQGVLVDGMQALSDKGTLPRNWNAEFMVGNAPDGVTGLVSFMWSWICDGDDERQTEDSLKQGWEFLNTCKSWGTVVVDTVTETTMLPFHQYLHTFFAAPAHLRFLSHSASRLTPSLIATIQSQPPPPGQSLLLFHHAHNASSSPALSASSIFANRAEHYIYAPIGFSPAGSTEAERAVTAAWADDLYARMQQTARDEGTHVEQAYWSFSRPEECDADRFFGTERVGRMRALKGRLNPGDALPMALPVVGLSS